ncbi:MAG: LysM peptidoglycan-binding domain-containing protein [Candidatus Riflebacteria bacterium]|nr:LysM peptidoglycan-binding domain-containing protein [Candidatus Riflebacteria bacterium]
MFKQILSALFVFVIHISLVNVAHAGPFEEDQAVKLNAMKSSVTKNSLLTPKKFHVVGSGDSLWKLARKYLGSGTKFQQIIELNKNKYPSLRNNPNLIMSGWKLEIPDNTNQNSQNMPVVTDNSAPLSETNLDPEKIYQDDLKTAGVPNLLHETRLQYVRSFLQGASIMKEAVKDLSILEIREGIKNIYILQKRIHDARVRLVEKTKEKARKVAGAVDKATDYAIEKAKEEADEALLALVKAYENLRVDYYTAKKVAKLVANKVKEKLHIITEIKEELRRLRAEAIAEEDQRIQRLLSQQRILENEINEHRIQLDAVQSAQNALEN